MNIYLLQIMGKWIGLIVISIASICGSVDVDEKKIDIDNDNKNKNLNVVNTSVEYTTITKYNRKLPSNTSRILVEGENGVVFQNKYGEIKRTIKEMVPKVVEVGIGPLGNFTGRMTGYGPDCYGCSKVGNVACRTKDRQTYSLINNGIYYNDDDYGQIRILAAETDVFPCGTIIEVSNSNFDTFIGVVMDTGGAMRKAWDNNQILIDLAFKTEDDPQVLQATSNNVNYSVKRWGW